MSYKGRAALSQESSGPGGGGREVKTFATYLDRCHLVEESQPEECGHKNIPVAASFLLSSSDFLSQSRPNKGPHRHRIKLYCLVADLISFHHKRPSQPCHCNLSHFFVRSIFVKSHLLCSPPHNLLPRDKAPRHNERGGIGSAESMLTVISLGPTPPDAWDSIPAAKEALVGPSVSGEKKPKVC